MLKKSYIFGKIDSKNNTQKNIAIPTNLRYDRENERGGFMKKYNFVFSKHTRILKKVSATLLGAVALSACTLTEVAMPKDEATTLTWYINFSWFDKEWGNDIVSQYITEKTGIHVEYIVPTGDESQFLQSILTGNAAADLITFEAENPLYASFLDQNVFVSLNALAEDTQSDFMNHTNFDTVQWYAHENNLYVYPNASYPLGVKQSYSNQSFLVRKDIYEAIGSPDMSTPEGFLNALEDAKTYCPIVNEKPLIPLGLQEFTTTGNGSLEAYLQNFLAIPYEENGEVIDRLLHADSVAWLAVMNQAYNKGLLLDDVFIDKRVQMEEKIARGQYFAMIYQWSDCTEQLMHLYETTPEAQYIAVDGPKNINGDAHTMAGSSVQGWTVTGIANTSPHQEDALELITFLMSDEGQKLIFLGIEGVTYHEIDGGYEHILLETTEQYQNTYKGTDVLWPMMNLSYAEEMGYLLESDDYFESIKNWSKELTKNFSLYTFPEFLYGSELYHIARADDLRKGNFLVEILTAKSDEEFHSIFQTFQAEREENGYQKILEERRLQLEENKKKLQQREGYA